METQVKQKKLEPRERYLCYNCAYRMRSADWGEFIFCRREEELTLPHLTCRLFEPRENAETEGK
jgi:hypothetical protein